MATGYTEISITDGTTTLRLNNFTDYSLQNKGWAPAIASRRRSKIGNLCPYEDVVENITISIIGSSPTNAIDKLNTLINFLERGRRNFEQENVGALYALCAPQGVTVLWGSAIVDAEVVMPGDFADLAPTNNIENVVVRIVRRGLWNRTDYPSSTSSAVGNGTSASVTYVAQSGPTYCTEIIWSTSADENPFGNYYNHPGYIAVSGKSGRISSGIGSVNVNDAANKPAGHGTNVSSFTNASAQYVSISGLSPAFDSSAKRVAVLGVFKNTVSSVPVKMSLLDSTTTIVIDECRFLIDGTNADHVTFCGVLNWNANAANIQFVATAACTATFDKIMLVDISDPYTSLIRIDDVSVYASQQALRTYHIWNPFYNPSPVAEGKTSAGAYMPLQFSGDAWMSIDASLGTAYCMRMASGGSGYWQPVSGAIAAITTTFQVKVIESSLMPRL